MEELLKWMRKEKFFMDKDGKWYSTNMKGRIIKNEIIPPKLYNEEELVTLYKKSI